MTKSSKLKNQRVSIHQTRFILCSQCYCSASCSTSRMPNLAICHYAKQRPPILCSINCNKIQTSFGQTCETFPWSNLRLYLGSLSIQLGYSCYLLPHFQSPRWDCAEAQRGNDAWQNEDAVDWPQQRLQCSSPLSTGESCDVTTNRDCLLTVRWASVYTHLKLLKQPTNLNQQ